MPEDTGVAQLLAARRAAREAEVAASATDPPKSAKDFYYSGLTPDDMNRLQVANQKPLSPEEFYSRPNQITENDIAIAQAPREYSLDNAAKNWQDMVHGSRIAVQDYAKRLAADPVGTVKQTAVGAATGVADTLTYPGRVLQGTVPMQVDLATGRVSPAGENDFVVDALGMMGGGGATRRLSGAADGIELGAMGSNRYVRSGGLYSRGAEAALELPQQTGTVQQMVNMLRKQPGVKEAELEASGILEMAEVSGADKITREALASKIEDAFPKIEARVYTPIPEDKWLQGAEGNRARYEEYTVPEGENYREVTLNYKDNPYPEQREKIESEIKNAFNLRLAARNKKAAFDSSTTPEERTRVENEIENFRKVENRLITRLNSLSDEYFTGGHHGDANTLAHVRMSDRVGPNGEKVLHVEEIQSDWGQRVREKGFRQRPVEDIDQDLYEVSEAYYYRSEMTEEQFNAKRKVLNNERKLPSSAPYVGNTSAWTDLALKHVLKTAADGNYDKIIYTPGAEHVGRFSLRNKVEKINYFPDENRIEITHLGETMDKSNVKPEDLPRFIGKELSEKLLKDENTVHFSTGNKGPAYHSLEGDGLEIGGDGMIDYYDNIVPKRLQALASQHDKNAKVGYTDVALPFKYAKESTAPGLTITPEMRASILKGQRAYAHGGIVTL